MGSAPIGVIICVSPTNSTSLESSADPSDLTGINVRIVPTFRSVIVSSL